MFTSSNNYTIIKLYGHRITKEGGFIVPAGNRHDRETDSMLITIKTLCRKQAMKALKKVHFHNKKFHI